MVFGEVAEPRGGEAQPEEGSCGKVWLIMGYSQAEGSACFWFFDLIFWIKVWVLFYVTFPCVVCSCSSSCPIPSLIFVPCLLVSFILFISLFSFHATCIPSPEHFLPPIVLFLASWSIPIHSVYVYTYNYTHKYTIIIYIYTYIPATLLKFINHDSSLPNCPLQL